MSLTAELALDAGADVGECPVWDTGRERLLWADIYQGDLHMFDPASGKDRYVTVGQPLGAVTPSTSEVLILAIRDGFATYDLETNHLELVAAVCADDPETLMNDGRCDRAGRFLAGTTTLSETTGAASLYRLGPGFDVDEVLPGVTLSNGIDWSLDGTTMYYVDSPRQRIEAFDYADDGALTNRRTLVDIPRPLGFPDGLTVDSEGCVWVALWGGGCVRRYSPTGDCEDVLELPVSQVASCGFGGADMGDLYVTTARWGFDTAQLASEPAAGGLFVARPGATGIPPTRFEIASAGSEA